jgi:hypothetical protein
VRGRVTDVKRGEGLLPFLGVKDSRHLLVIRELLPSPIPKGRGVSKGRTVSDRGNPLRRGGQRTSLQDIVHLFPERQKQLGLSLAKPVVVAG